MNVEQLHDVVTKLLAVESQYNISGKLAEVRAHLQQLTQDPQQTQFQTQLATTLDILRDATKSFLESFTPAEMKTFSEIEATDLFVSDIASEVDRLIRENPMTPQVALNAITNLVNRRQEYLENLQVLKQRVETLGIHGTRLEPGQAEIGILLPRELFQNHLRELIDELRALNRVIRAFSEVATGAPEPIEVHQISTSDPVFFFGISATTIAMFGTAVTWALNTWKQVEEIKKVRADAQRIRVFTDKEMRDIFDTKIDESIKNAIETHVKELLPPDKSEPRHHELRNDLAWALDSILTRVERGMTVEIRFLPPAATADAEASADFETIAQIAPELKFPPPEGAPVRPLPPPEPPSQSV